MFNMYFMLLCNYLMQILNGGDKMSKLSRTMTERMIFQKKQIFQAFFIIAMLSFFMVSLQLLRIMH